MQLLMSIFLLISRFNGRVPFRTGDVRLASKFTLRQRKEGNAQKPCGQYYHTSVSESVVRGTDSTIGGT